ncbi:uncharacterized protein METZ01_LOCUS397434, partial [marine metagenome]
MGAGQGHEAMATLIHSARIIDGTGNPWFYG